MSVMPYVIISISLGLPLLLGLLFRVSTSHLFFSLMAGELLARYFGDDAELILSSLVRNHNAAAYGQLALLVLPMVFTALFLKGSLSRGKVIFHFAPLLITGIVLAAFALPLLPEAAQAQVKTLEAGRQLLDAHEIIIGSVVFIQLIALWLLNRESHSKKHH